MQIISNALNLEKQLQSNPVLLLFLFLWVQQVRITRLEQLSSQLAAEIDRLRAERQCAA
jgi:hypothetical protein